MHNLLVAQSGGPTSAINATLSGDRRVRFRQKFPCE